MSNLWNFFKKGKILFWIFFFFFERQNCCKFFSLFPRIKTLPKLQKCFLSLRFFKNFFLCNFNHIRLQGAMLHPISLSLSLSHTTIHFLSFLQTHTLSLFFSLSLSLSLSLSFSHPNTHTLFLCFPFFSLTHYRFYSLPLTHTLTLSFTLSLCRTLLLFSSLFFSL